MIANYLFSNGKSVSAAARDLHYLQVSQGLHQSGDWASLDLYWVSQAELPMAIRTHHIQLLCKCNHRCVCLTAWNGLYLLLELKALWHIKHVCILNVDATRKTKLSALVWTPDKDDLVWVLGEIMCTLVFCFCGDCKIIILAPLCNFKLSFLFRLMHRDKSGICRQCPAWRLVECVFWEIILLN